MNMYVYICKWVYCQLIIVCYVKKYPSLSDWKQIQQKISDWKSHSNMIMYVCMYAHMTEYVCVHM